MSMVLRLIVIIPTPLNCTQGIQWFNWFAANTAGCLATTVLIFCLPNNVYFHGPEVNYQQAWQELNSLGSRLFCGVRLIKKQALWTLQVALGTPLAALGTLQAVPGTLSEALWDFPVALGPL